MINSLVEDIQKAQRMISLCSLLSDKKSDFKKNRIFLDNYIL